MSEKWPRLTQTLTGPRRWGFCQSCGAHHPGANQLPGLTLWQECDDEDRTQVLFLWLCSPCSDRLITPHPRLYHRIHALYPAMGAMHLCVDCLYCEKLMCTNPAARINGGPGIKIQEGQASRAFVDGRGRGAHGKRVGWVETIYYEPPKSCSGREEAVEL